MDRWIKPAFNRSSRSHNLHALEKGEFDVVICGGGINGAGLARDLALRAKRAGKAVRIALVEQRQFGSGTSSRNSQLIHGGLRYLKYLEFRLVRDALRERATLLRIAPHLVRPLQFVIPFYSLPARLYYDAGLLLYDWLAGRANVGKHRHLNANELRRLEPQLATERLHSAAIYYDCKVESARLVLENIFDAARLGVVVVNYVRLVNWHWQNGQFHLELQDALTGRQVVARARKVVDASGPWQQLSEVRRVRGSHLVFPKLTRSDYAIAHFADDGRIIFVIPWGPNNELSLVGTTDVEHPGSPDTVRIAPEEVSYLCRILEKLLPASKNLRPISAYSSLRPLADFRSSSATAASREHRIWNTDDNVLHIVGGKYTTYRLMCAEAADRVCEELWPELVGLDATSQEPVGGNSPARLEQLYDQVPKLANQYQLEEADARWLVSRYGVLAPDVLDYLPAHSPEGVSRLQWAVLRFAIEHEMAQRLADVLFVSTYWGWERSWEDRELEQLARTFATLMENSVYEVREEIELIRNLSALP